jgi:hypothetical protein
LYEASLSFGFDLDRIGGNDVASVQIFNGTWQTVWTETSRGTDTDGTTDLKTFGPIGVSGTVTQVRFSLKGNAASDTFLIDDVTIKGRPFIQTVSAPSRSRTSILYYAFLPHVFSLFSCFLLLSRSDRWVLCGHNMHL